LLQTFRPDYEMDDPALFAGRASQVEEVARALHSRGACPVIYGDRGLGKSSLALQGVRIAVGDTELLKRHRHEKWALSEESAYVTIFIRCSDATQTKDDLLQRALNAIVDNFARELWGEESHQFAEYSRRTGM